MKRTKRNTDLLDMQVEMLRRGLITIENLVNDLVVIVNDLEDECYRK